MITIAPVDGTELEGGFFEESLDRRFWLKHAFHAIGVKGLEMVGLENEFDGGLLLERLECGNEIAR